MLDWLARNTDLVALFLAVVGLGVSLFTVWLSVRQSRLDAYTRMHEMLVSSETARGRRILFLAHAQNAAARAGRRRLGRHQPVAGGVRHARRLHATADRQSNGSC